jgi:hypothetical protein
MYNLGYLLHDRSRDEAFTWYHKSAQRGYAPAMHCLGLLMQEDDRSVEAERWFRLAARERFSESMRALARKTSAPSPTRQRTGGARRRRRTAPALHPSRWSASNRPGGGHRSQSRALLRVGRRPGTSSCPTPTRTASSSSSSARRCARGRSAWVHLEGIAPSAEWMAEIEDAIVHAQAYVFVVSPDSAASAVCLDEAEIAAHHLLRAIEIAPAGGAPEGYPDGGPDWGDDAWTAYRYLDAERGRLRGRLHTRGAVSCIAIHPDAAEAVIGSLTGSVELWNLEAYERITILDGVASAVTAVAMSPAGEVVAAGADGSVLVWGADRPQAARSLFRSSGNPVTAIAFGPDDRQAFGLRDGQVILRAADGRELRRSRLHGGSVTSLSFDGTGRILTGSGRPAAGKWLGEGTALLWDPASDAQRTLLLGTVAGAPVAVAASPDAAAVLRSLAGGAVDLIRGSERERQLLAHPETVRAVAFSPGSAMAITGCEDGAIRTWDGEWQRDRCVRRSSRPDHVPGAERGRHDPAQRLTRRDCRGVGPGSPARTTRDRPRGLRDRFLGGRERRRRSPRRRHPPPRPERAVRRPWAPRRGHVAGDEPGRHDRARRRRERRHRRVGRQRREGDRARRRTRGLDLGSGVQPGRRAGGKCVRGRHRTGLGDLDLDGARPPRRPRRRRLRRRVHPRRTPPRQLRT